MSAIGRFDCNQSNFNFEDLCAFSHYLSAGVKLILRYSFNPFMTEALSYRNQPIDLRSKSMDWFQYDNGLRHERVKLTVYITHC